MAIDFKNLRKKMVPASAKAGSDIDSQWLEPSSYDKKMMNAMGADKPEVFDHEDGSEHSDNFKAQDLVKKNTKAPLRESESVETATDNAVHNPDAVTLAYEEEALDLFEEISELIEDVTSYVYWQSIVEDLKRVRDTLLACTLKEDYSIVLDEAFKVGSLKLKNGDKVKLTKEDVNNLNAAFAGTKNQKQLMNEITSDKSEFQAFLAFSRNLKEDYDQTMIDLLSEATEEQLQFIAESDLSEGDVWDHVAAGAKVGSVVGKSIAVPVGVIGGGVYGGAVGGAVGVVKNAGRYRKQIKDFLDKRGQPKVYKGSTRIRDIWEDANNEKESILGTSAPAMDSDGNSKKKEELQEISKDLVGRYISLSSKAAVGGAVNVGQLAGKVEPTVKDKMNEKVATHKVNRRMKGIDMAVKKLVKESDDYRGGHPANYRNPAAGAPKFGGLESGKKLDYYTITNNARDISGKLASKVGDIVNVKHDRYTTSPMEVVSINKDQLKVKPVKKDK